MKSSTVHYHKQILLVTSAFVLTASLVMVVMAGGGGVMPAMMMTTQQQVFAQPTDGSGEISQAGAGQQQTAAANTTTGGQATTIEMIATEEDETYRWAIDGNINPTITLTADVNNTITVNNPTDAVHELVIATTQGGEEGELAATKDVQPAGGQGQLSIIPNATQSLRYYCEYHPQTMLGDILITSATTTMTNATTTMTNQTQ